MTRYAFTFEAGQRESEAPYLPEAFEAVRSEPNLGELLERSIVDQKGKKMQTMTVSSADEYSLTAAVKKHIEDGWKRVGDCLEMDNQPGIWRQKLEKEG